MKTYQLLALGLVGALAFGARSHHSSSKAKGSAGQFDYYVLSLSWAPDFCATAGSNGTANECGAGRHVGFVVHGLWPQDNTSLGPENCGPSSPVSAAIVKSALQFFPTASLIQHEWTTHGTCSGLSAADYFNAVGEARAAVQIPVQLTALTEQTNEGTSQIEQEFAGANPSFPAGAFKATCTGGRLQEARVCFSRNLMPMACTASAGECRSATMTILPPR
jgi:ribonuclease T2